jgi:hypothetical protein
MHASLLLINVHRHIEPKFCKYLLNFNYISELYNYKIDGVLKFRMLRNMIFSGWITNLSGVDSIKSIL